MTDIHKNFFPMSVEMPWKLPKASVLIPYYGNRLEQLKRTLYMFEHQTYKNYEVWIIDDGSSHQSEIFNSINSHKQFYYVRLRKENAPARSPNKALLYGYENCSGKFVIVTSPEILVPFNAIETIITEGIPDRRNVPILYKLSHEQQRLINTVSWKFDLSTLKKLPNFWSGENMPGGFFNNEAKQNRTHGGFVGQTKEGWDRYGFLPDTEEWGKSDSYWHVEELKLGIPALPIDFEVYHQWHERMDAPQLSVRLKRIRELE